MPRFTYDLDPVTRITANAVGEPGQRIFYLQARGGTQLVSIVAEKEHIRALSDAIEQLLDGLSEKNPLLSSADDLLTFYDMNLEEPLEAQFRIAQMGLGYDEDRDLVVLVMQGLQDDDETPTARFSATRQQMRALSRHAADVVSKGRKVCGNCGQPMELSGHFCPRMN